MRRINKNILVFILSMSIILFGYCSKPLAYSLFTTIVELSEQVKTKGFENGIKNFENSIEGDYSNELRSRDLMMDLSSLFYFAENQRSIKKDEEVYIRANNDYLCGKNTQISEAAFQEKIDTISEVYEAALVNNVEFLYVVAPHKEYNLEYPENYQNYSKDNCDKYLGMINKSKIPYLDLLNILINDNSKSYNDCFFATDHHWTPETGLWATEQICKRLESSYGFAFNPFYTDITNYNVKVFNDWFLGSTGRKTGTYFTPLGPDDISLITPKFETNLIEEQPNKNERKEGTFEQTVLDLSNIETKDYYNKNPYATYSGGDFRLQIIKNNLSENDVKVVIVRDSFACVVTPFLALNVSELHIIDNRDGEYYVGEKIDLDKYIKKVKPDYVLQLSCIL